MDLLKKYWKIIFKILSVIALPIIALSVDSLIGVNDNPITFILLALFVIGLVYLLFPSFILKYLRLIILYFTPLLLYWTYIRLFSADFEAYLIIRNDVHLLFLLIPTPIIIGVFLWIYEQWKWVKTMKENQIGLELLLLKTQINPHFFFNTLNNLYALTVKKSAKAPEIILKLSEMMSYTIYEGKKDVVPIKDEITYLENYIELHKIRYHKSVIIEFEHSIEQGDTIAPLLFIILLENALKHGVESLMKNAFVKIHLSSNAKEVYFTIENNFAPHKKGKGRGIGLVNLKHRLSLIYGKRYEFTIKEKGSVFSAELKIKKHD